ncbi:Rop guanine nucleotide exchange factor 12 [Ancistrocladus abbreviatus]
MDERSTKSQGGGGSPKEVRKVGTASAPTNEGGGTRSSPHKGPSDMDLMKERFAKLLLGEDMSGGGKGVSSALALSNAITNLAASVFGEQKRLEPMPPERRARWRKEVDWLLSVTDHIVELVPSQQQLPDGSNMEVMVTRQRGDLLVNIPALRKLDAMLFDCLDNFKGQSEFGYVDSKDENEAEKASRHSDKWWIPTVKVPPGGLSDSTKKWLQYQKDCVNQVLKAAMAINAQILSEMEIPESYIEALPKNGRASLGDIIYKSITDEFFDPEHFLAAMDLTSEHKVLDLKNRIEASIVIWQRKMNQKDGKSSWGSGVSLEKRELFEERAETILLILKHQFPGIPQSSLDITKIQYNEDVGHSVLESYSRVLESLASAVLGRIDDVLYADNIARNSSTESNGKQSPPNVEETIEKTCSEEVPGCMTLMDFMGWSFDQGDNVKKSNSTGDLDEYLKDPEKEKFMVSKTPDSKKVSYLERLENWGGMKSPTARQ